MSFFSWLSGSSNGRVQAEAAAPPTSDWIQRVNRKLDLLLREMGVRLPDISATDNMPADIRGALATGNKIQAIKLYRERTGVGLVEAKRVIDGTSPPMFDIEAKLDLILNELGIRDEKTGTPFPAGGDSEIEALIRRGDMIQAIKLYRTRHGVDLRDAKEAVEAIQRSLRSVR